MMTSPRNQAEALMNDLLPFAKQMLAQHGEFYPYGGFMRSDGSIVHVGAKHPATRHPRSADLLQILKEGLRENAEDEKMIAAAILCRGIFPLSFGRQPVTRVWRSVLQECDRSIFAQS